MIDNDLENLVDIDVTNRGKYEVYYSDDNSKPINTDLFYDYKYNIDLLTYTINSDINKINFNIFIEGETGDKWVTIYEINTTNVISVFAKNNFVDLSLFKYGYYKLEYNNYYKFINPQQTIIPGYINGNINLKSCGDVDIKIHCYRNGDHFFIGEYSPTTDGYYEIPNLDVNTKYDVVMVDNNRLIEQKIISYQTPKSY